MTAVTGVSSRIAAPWSRVAMSAPVPVAEAARERRLIWLSGHVEMARRFPRTALAFPYHAAMCAAPLMTGSNCWGVVLLLWPGTHAAELSGQERDVIGAAAHRMGQAMRQADVNGGRAVRTASGPRALDHPRSPRLRAEAEAHSGADLVERLQDGLCAMDLDGRITYLNNRAAELLGSDRRGTLGARLWEALPWLSDPAYENLYLSALFSRLPTSFTARRPTGTWLSFQLFPDLTGVSVRITPTAAPASAPEQPPIPPAGTQTSAGSLFYLMHLASALTQAVEVKDVTDCVVDQIMPVINAQGLALLSTDDGKLKVLTSSGFPQRIADLFDGLPLTIDSASTRVIQSGTPAFFSDDDELRRAYPHMNDLYTGLGPMCYLPLLASGRAIGCCILRFERPHPFAREEKAALTSLAGMIAQALERARLYDTQTQIARGLQRVLLPSMLPEVPGLKSAARYLPATRGMDIGGDFYDLIHLDRDHVAAVIGDVQGHNVNAAALMGQLRMAIQAQATSDVTPGEVMGRANRLLTGLNSDLFASCLYCEIDLRTGVACAAVAGHPPPFIARPGHGAEVLDVPPGILLGVEPDATYESAEFQVEPGAQLAFYTDGLVERPGIDLRMAIDDLARQFDELRPLPLDTIADTLIRRAQSDGQGGDDIALLLLDLEAYASDAT